MVNKNSIFIIIFICVCGVFISNAISFAQESNYENNDGVTALIGQEYREKLLKEFRIEFDSLKHKTAKDHSNFLTTLFLFMVIGSIISSIFVYKIIFPWARNGSEDYIQKIIKIEKLTQINDEELTKWRLSYSLDLPYIHSLSLAASYLFSFHKKLIIKPLEVILPALVIFIEVLLIPFLIKYCHICPQAIKKAKEGQ